MKARVLSPLSLSLIVLPAAGLVLTVGLALRAQNRPPAGSTTASSAGPHFNYAATSLWLSAAQSVSNNGLNGTVYGTIPGSPYFLLSSPSLSSTSGWYVEQLLIGK